MARTKTTRTPATRPARTGSGDGGGIKEGDTIRIDGHDYDVKIMHESGLAFGWTRPDGLGEGDTKYRYGSTPVSDVRHDPEIGYYLPNRITPKVGDLVAAAVESGALTEEQGPQVINFIRNHPHYADRDDKAVKAAEDAYGISLWEV